MSFWRPATRSAACLVARCVWIVNTMSDDPDAIWVPEVWCSEADHAASLTDERVRVIIARASSLMTGFGERFTLEPVAGKELIDPVQ